MTRLAWNNLALAGTMSASSAASSYAADSVLSRWPTETWRSTGKSSEWLKCDLGASPGSVDSVVLYGHNLSLAATIHLQANASDS
jgi:hypothetical protein